MHQRCESPSSRLCFCLLVVFVSLILLCCCWFCMHGFILVVFAVCGAFHFAVVCNFVVVSLGLYLCILIGVWFSLLVLYHHNCMRMYNISVVLSTLLIYSHVALPLVSVPCSCFLISLRSRLFPTADTNLFFF